ncbi:MAG: hypothetical protein ACRYFW_14285 [Janthinobacterium lividum]
MIGFAGMVNHVGFAGDVKKIRRRCRTVWRVLRFDDSFYSGAKVPTSTAGEA